MGAEYFCYGSDVTCTFPSNGKFTKEQQIIYEGVLSAQKVVLSMLKPGVSWVDCHQAAEYQILSCLYKLDIVNLQNKTLNDLVDLRLSSVFMPHGLGHFIGIDTHDVGGYLPGNPPRITLPGLKSLRTTRFLEENMTLTVEPGCYFIDYILDEALSENSIFEPYLNKKVLNQYRGFGGIRLEDVCAITADGCINFTVCPRTVKEVEYVKSGGKWPPLSDEAPELKRKRLLDTSLLMGTKAFSS